MNYFNGKRVLIAGGGGFLGQHLIKRIRNTEGFVDCTITVPRRADYDFRQFDVALKALKEQDIVINLAANVGGIGYNQKYPGTLFYDNITMGVNLIEAARRNDVSKFVQVGTVCSYPKFTKVPFSEDDFWNGYPEETNAPYGIAKKALYVMADGYHREYGMNIVSLIPVNLYGPGDNFHPENSHVIPALIRKFVEATDSGEEDVTLWGTGSASREFLYVNDAAEAITLATMKYNKTDLVNLGTGREITIRDLALKIGEITGFKGSLRWDASRPDGQPRRSLNTERALKEFGFRAGTDFDHGLRETISWYRKKDKV